MTQAETRATPADSAHRERDPLRSDAQHNRERIVDVARDALGTSRDASLNSIAKKAGVGPGTLYRHFPSRDALVLAVYGEDVRTLADLATHLLAQHDPVQALRLWFDRLATYGMTNRSLAGALQSATTAATAERTCAPITEAAAYLLSACQQDGNVGPNIEPDDIWLLLSFLWRIEPGPSASLRVARLLDLVMSALQAGAPRNANGSRRRLGRRALRRPRMLSLISSSAPFPVRRSRSPAPPRKRSRWRRTEAA
jgi:AcrR family transcriptional regulator